LEEFNKRFENFKDKKEVFNFMQDPFSCSVDNLPVECQLEVIDLQCKAELKAAHKDSNILTFFKNLDCQMFGNIRNLALRMSTVFGSTYICEQTFSIMNLNKNTLRLNVTDQNLQAVLRMLRQTLNRIWIIL